MRTLLRIALVVLTATIASPTRVQAQACPTRVLFEPTADGTLDAGWSGIFHDMPIIGPTLDLTIHCAASMAPCGTCAITGFTPTSTSSWRRCANDTAIACTVADEVAECGAADTCLTYLSPPTSIGSGLPFCYTAHAAGTPSGTVKPDTGEFNPIVPISGDIRVGVFADVFEGGANQGCPRCVGDAVPNDGVRGGTCDAGPRAGLACDVNGTSPFADYASSSFDCPHVADVSTVPFELGGIPSAAADQAIALSTASPQCTGSNTAGKRCLCATCNTAAAEACRTDLDCPPSGGNPGICNGRRCLGGPDAGTPCASNASCSSNVCSRPGEPTKPNSCSDDTTTPETEACAPIGGGRGECSAGPIDVQCSNHPNRGCNDDHDCDDVPGACGAFLRRCFLDNGVIGGTVSVTGTATPPVAGIAAPTDLSTLTCLRPTESGAYNIAFGLPGLVRARLPGRLRFDAAGATPTPAATPTPTATPTPISGVCPMSPAVCRQSLVAGKSTLQITDKSPDDKDQLAWKWSQGAATTLADLGDPTTSDAYALCLYDAASLVATMQIPPAGICSGKPCWKAKSTGFTFRSTTADPNGITQVTLRAGTDRKAQIQVKGKGDLLPLPALATLTSTLEMQLRNRSSGLCWGTTFVPPFDKVTATQLKDKAD